MKRLYINLKRFDVPAALGGVNRDNSLAAWAPRLMEAVQRGLSPYAGRAVFTAFLPELHLLGALGATDGSLHVGCQGVHWKDVRPGGNFGALTTSRPAAAMKAAGCGDVIIGHCEERTALRELGADVDRTLNAEVLAARGRELAVLFCVGETEHEHANWRQAIGRQLENGLRGAGQEGLCVAYEPVWAIGPGKTPAGREHIQEVCRFIKKKTGDLSVVYGGGLKQDNAAMLAAIPELDGGLVALTRFVGEIGFYPDEFLEIVGLYLTGEVEGGGQDAAAI